MVLAGSMSARSVFVYVRTQWLLVLRFSALPMVPSLLRLITSMIAGLVRLLQTTVAAR